MTQEPRDFTRHVDTFAQLADKDCLICQEPRKGMMLCEGTWIDCRCLRKE